MTFDKSNEPNAARLIESLRYLGYGNYEAIADLVDNCIDADADHVSIHIKQHKGDIVIAVADDGIGMDRSTLDEAMRLGSDISRDINSDLGKFGMGLVTASLSMARRCHVVTRGPEGCFVSIQDIDEVIRQNLFVKELDVASRKDVEYLDSRVGPESSGTVVTLSSCDHITNRRTSSFADVLRNHLGRVHRYFIGAGKEITVNGDRVEIRDPLQLGDSDVVLDELVSVKAPVNGRTREENVRVRIALVPDITVSDTEARQSIKNQGFYVMRNQREVMNAVTLDFFLKHGEYNRVRGEIFFPGTLDGLVGIEFTKRQVNLEQGLHDQLSALVKPVLRSVRMSERTNRNVETSEEQKQLHRRSAKAIAEKNKLLLKPKARIDQRASPVREGGTATKSNGKGERKNLSRTQDIEAQTNCEFREEKLGPNGQIYEAHMDGRKTVIRYNVEHPFYKRFIVDVLADGKSASATDFMIYSMAAAELRLRDDMDVEAINSFKMVMSANLRTLLN